MFSNTDSRIAERLIDSGTSPLNPDFPDNRQDPDNRSAEAVFHRASAELEYRVHSGDENVCESILRKYPEISRDSDRVLELIYLEFVLCQELGKNPDPLSFAARFPELQAEIVKLMDVDRIIRKEKSAATATVRVATLDTWMNDRAAGAELVDQVGDYELLEEVGRGAMGVVYRARQRRLGRMVAVKTVESLGPLSPSILARFKAEAELASRLQHPNIVQIHEIGAHSSIPYFSMELVTGGTLADATRDRPLQPQVAAQLLETLARAVAYAHSQGVVHRDLKPANVLLATSSRAEAIDLKSGTTGSSTRRVEPKIVDFGLAKNLESQVQHTRTGTTIGTPSYMAPEQIDGNLRHSGPSCDIYSLGAILYDVLVGRPPFYAATVLETLNQVRNEEPIAPRKLQDKIPLDLETICLTCLQKDPVRRYKTADELADDLRRYLNRQPIHARPAGLLERTWKWARRHPSLAALIVAVFLATISIGALWWRAEQSRTAEQLARQRGEGILYDRDLALAHLEYRSHNVSRSREILSNTHPEYRGWEWDYLDQLCGEAYFESPAEPLPAVSAALSPDGRYVATGHGRWGFNYDPILTIWDVDTQKLVRRLTSYPPCQISDVQFSHDGRSLLSAAVVWNNPGEKAGVKVWDLDTGNVRFDVGNSDAYVARYSPDGKSIFVGNLTGTICQHCSQTGELVREFKSTRGMILDLEFGLNGQLLASASRGGAVAIWDLKSGTKLQEIGDLSDPRRLAWSPDGKQLIVGQYGGMRLHYRFEDNQLALRGTLTKAALPYVKFTPDGSVLAMAVFGEGLSLCDPASGLAKRVFYGHGGHVRTIAFDATGRRMATAGNDGITMVWDLTRPALGPRNASITGHLAALVSCPTRPELALAITRNRTKSATFSGTPRIELLDERTLRKTKTLRGHTDWATCLVYNHDGSRLVSGSADKTVRIWDLQNGKTLAVFRGHHEPIVGVAIDSQSELGISVDTTGIMNTWRMDDAALKQSWRVDDQVSSLTMLPQTSIAVIATETGNVSLWDVSAGKRLATREVGYRVNSVCVSPDGVYTATPGARSAIEVWRTKDLLTTKESRPTMVLAGHSNSVTGVAFSPDARRLVSCSTDATTRLFDVTLGKELLVLDDAEGHINFVQVSANGKHITRARNSAITSWSTEMSDKPRPELNSNEYKNSAIAWHNAAIREAKSSGNHFASVFHRSELIALQPDRKELYSYRGTSRILANDWERAAEDLLVGLEHKEDAHFRAWLAKVYLKLGHTTEYRRHCQLAFDYLDEKSSPLAVNAVAWIASLTNESQVDPERIIPRLEKSIEKDPKATYYNTLALVCYRAGRFSESIQHAKKSLKLDANASVPMDWWIIALSQAQLAAKERAGSQADSGQNPEIGGTRNQRNGAYNAAIAYRRLVDKWVADQLAKDKAGEKTSPNFHRILPVELPLFQQELDELIPP